MLWFHTHSAKKKEFRSVAVQRIDILYLSYEHVMSSMAFCSDCFKAKHAAKGARHLVPSLHQWQWEKSCTHVLLSTGLILHVQQMQQRRGNVHMVFVLTLSLNQRYRWHCATFERSLSHTQHTHTSTHACACTHTQSLHKVFESKPIEVFAESINLSILSPVTCKWVLVSVLSTTSSS